MFTVKKRTDVVVDYDVERIKRAIANADSDSAGDDMSAKALNDIIEFVETSLPFDDAGAVTVENIQDTIEGALMDAGYKNTAKSYIIYRDHQKTRRELAKRNPVVADAVAAIKKLSAGLRIDPSLIITSDIASIEGALDNSELLEQVLLRTLDVLPVSEDYDFLAGRIVLMRSQLEATKALARNGKDYSYRNIVDELVEGGLYDPDMFSPTAPHFAQVSLDGHLDMIDSGRDDYLNYLSAKTLVDRYLVRNRAGIVLETPQMMFFRMAVAFSSQPGPLTFEEVYESLSTMLYFNSTPSMFNAGLVRPQMASCYLSTIIEDSLEGIYATITDNARLSKFAGGLGISATPIRAANALIKGTNGVSNGVIPWLKNAETMVVSVNQGGKRRGSACVYLDSWHADIWGFLQLKAEGGDEFMRTHALDTSNWIPDLLMQRAIAREEWSLFSPDEVPELIELKGEAFNEKYREYEEKGLNGELRIFNRCQAYDLLKEMLSQLYETGGSWINFKDPSTMRYMGSKTKTVKSSNLCTEILEVADAEETAVCTLGSIVLTNHLIELGKGQYEINWSGLAETTKRLIRALDTTIDYNFYPSKLAARSNANYRHLGAGVAGIDDLMSMLKIPFDSEAAVDLNHEIMEFISYHAIQTSIDLARDYGPFPMFSDSHWADGKVPLDLYCEFNDYRSITEFERFSKPKLNWDVIRERLLKYGIRNATQLAIAPTATSSNICMVSPSNEPTYANIFVKGNLSGQFTEVNRVLRRQLGELGLWTPDMIEKIIESDGTIQNIPEIPQEIRDLHKTAFEMDSIWTIKNAAARNPWIDQSQSLNFYIRGATGRKLFDNYTTAWNYGLKTTYYLRTLAAEDVDADEELAESEEINIAVPAMSFIDFEPTGKACGMEPGCTSCE